MNCPHCTQPIEYTDNHELTINCPHCNGLIEVDRLGIGVQFMRAYQQIVYMHKIPELFWPATERQFAGDSITKLIYP
jgi:hypothetical protein